MNLSACCKWKIRCDRYFQTSQQTSAIAIFKHHNKQMRSLFSNITTNKCDRYFQTSQKTSAIAIFKHHKKQVRSPALKQFFKFIYLIIIALLVSKNVYLSQNKSVIKKIQVST